MSRLIIKNLPKSINEEKLRSLFGEKGTLTDVQLKYKDGVFRRFAFVGYQNEEEAKNALNFFNNSFIQTAKIKVELCESLGSHQPTQKKASNDQDQSEAKQLDKKSKKKKKDIVEELFEEHKDDPQFSEFLEVTKAGRNLWDNDALIAETTDKIEKVQEKSKKVEETVDEGNEDDSESGIEQDEGESNEKLAEKNVSDLDYMKSLMGTSANAKQVGKTASAGKKDFIDLFTIKIHGIPYKTKRQDILKLFKPIKPHSVRLPSKVHGFCYIGFKTEKEFKKAMLKNKTFLKGKQLFFSDFTEQNKKSKPAIANITKPESSDVPTDEKINNKFKKTKSENTEDISESGQIFFRNLAYTVTENDLTELFEKYGPIAEINLPVDNLTTRIKGFGTITYVMPEHAVLAFSELDGTMFHGRLLHLIPGKSKDDEAANEDDENTTNFKAKKALKLKKSAEKSYNWNTLFLGANAVAETMSKTYSTSKEVILDPNSGGTGAAVRLALGETQIVMEMRKFLEENDVHLEAFVSTSIKRSKNVILVKNLPSGTVVSELSPLFVKFGQLGRVILPPSGVTAIVEFISPTDARQAFKKLAYTKFKNLPLYLEWAPENTFKNECDKRDVIHKKNPENKVKEEEETTNDVGKGEEDKEDSSNKIVSAEDDTPPEPNTTIFLRNLNFKTREPAIREHFKSLGKIHMIQVAMRKDPENPRNKVSLGYGFIQFKENKVAEKALKEMQCTLIEGNQVELKRSDRILKSDQSNQRKQTNTSEQTGTKILVRNIPFQAKSNEVRELFKTFGELNSVRLPKKMTPGEETHRGFGFVDFVTKDSAKQAFDALCHSTHLYGRRLVLEWAAVDDDNVGNLRKRTAESFHASSQGNKKLKGVFDADIVNSKKLDANEDDDEEG